MRVFLSTDVVGGVWRYTVTLVRELVDRGHACAVAVLGAPDEARLEELPAGVEVVQRDVRLEWMEGGLTEVPATTTWLAEAARSWGADVVHLSHYGYAVGDFGAPVLVVAHSDIRSWFSDVKGREAPDGWAEYTAVVRAGMEAADVVVAPTAYQSGRLAQHYGRTATRVIHNGMRPPPVPVNERPASERSMLLVAGRAWDHAKGVGVLESALEELGDRAPTVHVVGPMEGPNGEAIKVERLVAHGEVPGAAMARFYANARVYIGPSLYEPFGLSPLEAAAHGCGLLLSDIGSFRELWQDAASFFHAGRSHDLGVRLLNLLEDPATLDAQAGAARTRARTRYTAARMADQYEAVYRELLGRPGPATVGEPAPEAPSRRRQTVADGRD